MTCLTMLDQSTIVFLFFSWSVMLLFFVFSHGSIFLLITIVACLISSVGSFPCPVDSLGPCILRFCLKSCQKSRRYGSFHTDVCAFLLNLLAAAPGNFSCGFAHETWTVLPSVNADCSTLYMHFLPSLSWRCSLWTVFCIALIIQSENNSGSVYVTSQCRPKKKGSVCLLL